MKFTKTVIDSHMHLYDWFDENGTDYFKLFDDIQENTGLKGLSLAGLTDKIYGGVDNNIMLAFYKLHNPSAFAKAGVVYPFYPLSSPLPCGMDMLTQYNELMEIGFDGFKFLYKPDTQKQIQLPINDELFEPLFAQSEKNNTHFTWHVADPDFFWKIERGGDWCYTDGTYPSFREMLEQVYDVLERHPKLNVTFAHFLFMSEHTDVLEYLFDRFENVSIDVTPGTEMYVSFTDKPDFYREFLEKHSDRILFGTDAEIPKNNRSELLIRSVYTALTTTEKTDIWGADVTGLGLSDKACENILYKNHMKYVGETPKKICVPALLKYIDKYSHLITNEVNKTEILRYAEKLS